jgi:EmrB/QacA subfamily drug resistance transporter
MLFDFPVKVVVSLKSRLSNVEDSAQKRSVLFVAVVSSFLTPFMASATNVALPAIQAEFHLDAITLAWVPTIYLISCAVLLLPFGKLADIYGRRKIFIYGIWVFTVSSLLTALAPTVPILLFSRVIGGVSSAMIFSTGLAIITSVFPPQERGGAIGITVAAVYIGLSSGPFIGGALTNHFTWRAVFAVTIPLGVATIYLATWKLAGEWAEAQGQKLDIIGGILYGSGIMLVMWGFSTLPSYESFCAMLIGIGLIGFFVWWEGRTTFPLINLELFSQNRTFALSSLAALIHYSGTMAVTFLLSLYLQYIKNLTPQAAGLVLMVQPLIMAICSPVAGKISDRFEPRYIASLGMALTAIGLFALTSVQFDTHTTFILLSLVLLGFGYGLFSSPNMNAIMSSVDKEFYGVAAGTVGSVRLIGTMLSMGITTLVFSLHIGRVAITPQYYPVFLESVKTAFTIFAVLCIPGIFASMARGRLRQGAE